MKIDLVNQENSTVKSINISDSVFKSEVNHGLIHELVTSYRSNGRSATKAQKNRSRVSGGGAKPHPQKKVQVEQGLVLLEDHFGLVAEWLLLL